MKWSTPIVCFILIAAITSFTSCHKKASEEIDPGTYTNSVYHNNFFNMNIQLPTTWSFQDKASMESLKNVGKSTLKGNNKELNERIDQSDYHTFFLFAIFKYSVGTPVRFNPNIICIAEPISQIPTIQSGKDYLLQCKKVLQSSRLNVKYPREIYSQLLGGVSYDVLYSEMDFMNRLIHQKQYVMIKRGYAITFTISYTNPEQEAEIKKILNTLTFK